MGNDLLAAVASESGSAGGAGGGGGSGVAAAPSLGRLHLKTPFDRNVVTQMDSMETVLDYGLAHLGLNEGGEAGRVPHPVVITEPPANPSTSRARKFEHCLAIKSFFRCSATLWLFGFSVIVFVIFSFFPVMNELLFECYGVPSVCAGVDALFSLFHQKGEEGARTALVISIGFHTVHVLPYISKERNGKLLQFDTSL